MGGTPAAREALQGSSRPGRGIQVRSQTHYKSYQFHGACDVHRQGLLRRSSSLPTRKVAGSSVQGGLTARAPSPTQQAVCRTRSPWPHPLPAIPRWPWEQFTRRQQIPLIGGLVCAAGAVAGPLAIPAAAAVGFAAWAIAKRTGGAALGRGSADTHGTPSYLSIQLAAALKRTEAGPRAGAPVREPPFLTLNPASISEDELQVPWAGVLRSRCLCVVACGANSPLSSDPRRQIGGTRPARHRPRGLARTGRRQPHALGSRPAPVRARCTRRSAACRTCCRRR